MCGLYLCYHYPFYVYGDVRELFHLSFTFGKKAYIPYLAYMKAVRFQMLWFMFMILNCLNMFQYCFRIIISVFVLLLYKESCKRIVTRDAIHSYTTCHLNGYFDKCQVCLQSNIEQEL